MFKKIGLLSILTVAFYTSQSQVLISLLLGDKLNSDKIEFGLDGGLNYSQMSGFESSKMLPTFNIGFYFDFKLKNQLYLNSGMLVKSNVGLDALTQSDVSILDTATVYFSGGNYSQKTSYFHIPIALKYRFKNHFYVHAGPQFALRSKAFLIFKGEQNNKEVEIKTDNRALFTRLEVAAIAGVGYKLKKGTGMNIGVKYFYGLTNIFKDDYFNARNSSLYVYVGIPIGKEKSPAK